MSKYYIKKPIPIKAEPYREGLEDGFDFYDSVVESASHLDLQNLEATLNIESELMYPYIRTLEGKHYIHKGSYIVTGVRGERYPYKKDIFEETYEEYTIET